jgi:hypothetical protein
LFNIYQQKNQMPSGAMQNGFILADNKLVQIQCDPQSSQQHAYAIVSFESS